jgi:predicted metalloprotease with PDZ domain
LICAAILAASLTAAAAATDTVEYELRFEKPSTHRMEVTVRASGLKGPTAEFAMPAWAPGSYGINDYAKNVQGFRATGPGEKELAWRKADKQTWRVETGGANTVTVRYELYANTLANNWAQYNERHAFIGGPAAWMYLVGGKERPVRLVIATPPGWRVATGMTRVGENTFAAADYDWFVDSPIEISDFAEQDFTVDGTTYRVVVHDGMGRKDFSQFTRDAKKIVETIVPMYGAVAGSAERPAPFAEYCFLMHIWPNAGGGLEHLNSTQINYSSDWDSTRPRGRNGTDYQLKLFVLSHEFYHAWNVKRLRPRPLGPFDYSREANTGSLWISEGLTSYYGDLALVRAGLVPPQAYLDSIAALITEFEQLPGRKERSIEETSWDTWFRSSGPGDTNLQNTSYSYYDGGQIVGHLLDFVIRQATNNQKSLDDWMRLLYQRYSLPKPGFEPQDAIRAASETAGKDLSDFFQQYISGKNPLPYEECFRYAGIEVERSRAAERGWTGIRAGRGDEGRARINNISPGSPAEEAGLDRNDVVVAVDGKVVDESEFQRVLEALKPGGSVHLSVIRSGELKEFTVTPVPYPFTIFRLRPAEKMTDLQRRIYESWTGNK